MLHTLGILCLRILFIYMDVFAKLNLVGKTEKKIRGVYLNFSYRDGTKEGKQRM